VKAETQLIRQTIEAKVGHSAEDKGVVIMYDTEQGLDSSYADKLRNSMIIEIPKSRPAWFSSNLLQRSTAGVNTEAKAVTKTPPKPVISSSSDSSDK
jgi:large subunit ribosomal protein L32